MIGAIRNSTANLVARVAYAAVTNGNATTLTLITLLATPVARRLRLRKGNPR